ncbi:hypothetical protein AVEN_239846-1 [Araneus ventricosus]|uniref:Uncharacterized protein n=1 Tax=Araneus ventricosus TaxID=182803 RepID=A0A4Y2VFM5_ARAVE|nr:hypothetical protein AVEN_239846-1 [Araneus ventricosus]
MAVTAALGRRVDIGEKQRIKHNHVKSYCRGEFTAMRLRFDPKCDQWSPSSAGTEQTEELFPPSILLFCVSRSFRERLETRKEVPLGEKLRVL